ncbi:hypothetical protein BDW02DRAFT_571439 [Decorospora gaudefroyi]|uniref:Uncharacterized protein n=1 Tax=Decorospora gaudefroyi TaxID=184978 RepID=A0A6A5K507_9PLEO|nr:hypothetical protein BDW02DRAFT_571439 [Decorospora gaudefroyi]
MQGSAPDVLGSGGACGEEEKLFRYYIGWDLRGAGEEVYGYLKRERERDGLLAEVFG